MLMVRAGAVGGKVEDIRFPKGESFVDSSARCLITRVDAILRSLVILPEYRGPMRPPRETQDRGAGQMG